MIRRRKQNVEIIYPKGTREKSQNRYIISLLFLPYKKVPSLKGIEFTKLTELTEEGILETRIIYSITQNLPLGLHTILLLI